MEKKTHTLLMDKVHFANGVALSVKEDFLVIAETVRGRVFRLVSIECPRTYSLDLKITF